MEELQEIKQQVRGKLPKDSIELYVKYLENNNYSYNTINRYIKIIGRLINYEKPKTILLPGKIKKFLGYKINIQYRSAIKRFLQFLQEEHDFEIDNFTYPRLPKSTKVTIPFNSNEIKILIDAMPDDKLFYRFKLLTELLSRSGMRISEAVGLRIGDILFKEWLLDRTKHGLILLKNTKNNRQRILPMKPDLMKKLAVYCSNEVETERELNQDKCFVFDFKYDETIKRYKRKQRKAKQDPTVFSYDENLWDLKYIEKSCAYYRKILDRTSMKILKKHCYCHLLRHGYATTLDNMKVQTSIIQLLMGHKNISTTSLYLHPSEQQLEVGAI